MWSFHDPRFSSSCFAPSFCALIQSPPLIVPFRAFIISPPFTRSFHTRISRAIFALFFRSERRTRDERAARAFILRFALLLRAPFTLSHLMFTFRALSTFAYTTCQKNIFNYMYWLYFRNVDLWETCLTRNPVGYIKFCFDNSLAYKIALTTVVDPDHFTLFGWAGIAFINTSVSFSSTRVSGRCLVS